MLPARVMMMAMAATVAPPTVQLVAQEHRSADVSPADVTASFSLGSDRQATGSGDPAYAWLDAAANPALYQVTVSEVSGTFTTGAAGTFSLGTTRTWTKARTLNTAGESIASARFQIALIASPGIILADAVISLVAEVTAGATVPTVSLFGGDHYASDYSPADVTASFTLGADRLASGSGASYPWLSEDGNPASYEVVVSEQSGVFSTGSVGTFNLGTTQTWSKTRINNFAGQSTVLARFQIREVANPGIILADAYISMTAEVFGDGGGGNQ